MKNTDSRPWSFRRAGEEDLELLALLEDSAFAFPWTRRMIRDALISDHQQFWLLQVGSEAAAYVCLLDLGVEAEFMRVGVSPEYRRQGLATALLSALLARLAARGTQEVFLEVRVHNAPAIALYEKLGFESVGLRKRYYQALVPGQPKEDAYVMRADLAKMNMKEENHA